jgi:integrase
VRAIAASAYAGAALAHYPEADGDSSVLRDAVDGQDCAFGAGPVRRVKRLRIDNRRTRILSADEQRALLAAAPRKLRALIILALITGARIGELLRLRWEDCADGYVTFWQTKKVMEISGHSSTRMLARYTHSTAARKQGALETFGNERLGQNLGQSG